MWLIRDFGGGGGWDLKKRKGEGDLEPGGGGGEIYRKGEKFARLGKKGIVRQQLQLRKKKGNHRKRKLITLLRS